MSWGLNWYICRGGGCWRGDPPLRSVGSLCPAGSQTSSQHPATLSTVLRAESHPRRAAHIYHVRPRHITSPLPSPAPSDTDQRAGSRHIAARRCSQTQIAATRYSFDPIAFSSGRNTRRPQQTTNERSLRRFERCARISPATIRTLRGGLDKTQPIWGDCSRATRLSENFSSNLAARVLYNLGGDDLW